MSEILQGLEHRAQAQGNADEAAPVVDMRSARLLTIALGTADSAHLPQAKGLLKQLLTFPRPTDGIVPDAWGTDKRADIKRISTDVASVYTLDRGVQGVS